MKILLIQPPFTIFKTESKKCHPPLGLAYLAAALKDRHSVFVLDALAEGYNRQESLSGGLLRYGLSFSEIKAEVMSLKPDLVCVSCLFSAQAQNVHRVCEVVKEADKKIITVMGGAHPSSAPEKVLQDTNVDFAVIGEGEKILSRLSECIENNRSFQGIEGLGFRSNGQITINHRKNYEENLDNIAFPYWDIFPLERYFRINNPHGSPAKRTPFLPMITSRGCPFNCIFCSVHNLWGKDYRVRSSENILSEISYLKDKFGIKEIMFEDDNLTLRKERAKAIFSGMINRNFRLSWSTPNGVAVQTLDDEIVSLMKKSGCYGISIGVESGDEYMLKNIIGKLIELSMVKPIIRKADQLGMDSTVFFVVGLPGENLNSIKNTFRFAESLNADNINFFFAAPLPGTRLLELCKAKNLLGELDYGRLKPEQPYFATEYLSKEQLVSLVNSEKTKLYLLFLLRKPHKFLYKLGNRLFRDPVYLFRKIIKLMQR